MCLKAGVPEKPKKGECCESHGLMQSAVALMGMMVPLVLMMQQLVPALEKL